MCCSAAVCECWPFGLNKHQALLDNATVPLIRHHKGLWRGPGGEGGVCVCVRASVRVCVK